MEGFNERIDLSKLNQVGLITVKSKTGENVKCVLIPVEANDIFLAESGSKYLDLQCVALKEGRFGQSHIVKRSIPSAKYKAMSEEEKKAIPIVGNLSPIKPKESTEPAPMIQPSQDDELPFW